MSTLILIRHAHRDVSDRSQDNGLSDKGKEQSRRILKYFRRRFDPDARVRLLSSPKLRCIETLEPLSRFLGSEIAASKLLLETQDGESPARLRARVSRLIAREIEPCREIVVLCSHGDWLPIAIKQLCGANVDLKKGSWTEIEDGRLVRLLQSEDF